MCRPNAFCGARRIPEHVRGCVLQRPEFSDSVPAGMRLLVQSLSNPVGQSSLKNRTQPGVHCTAQVETLGRTGVEMEALTAGQVGLLTVYDMCKAVDRGMTITDVKVMEKHGGKSGDWVADPGK